MLRTTAAFLLAGAAAAAPTMTKNITVYRITPRNYTGLTNFDTGDAAGDAFFGIYELQAPLVCSGDPHAADYNLLCRNEPILQIPGFNVYTRTILETDARLGDYSQCNPDPQSGIFTCGHFHRHYGPAECWFNSTSNPEWATNFASVCDRATCLCDAVEKLAVGYQDLGSTFGGAFPADWPQQCLDNFYAIDGYIFGGKNKPTKTLANTDEGACCSACANEKRSIISGCGGYTWSSADQTCQLFSRWARPSVPAPLHNHSSAVVRSGMNLEGTPYHSVLGSSTEQIAALLNGSWYSTREEGECPAGSGGPTGDGKCWWREVAQTSNVNASCVNGNLIRVIKAAQPNCWEACGADADNLTSKCFIKCLFNAVAGNKTKGWPPMTAEVLVNAFEKSFDSDDKEFGCPQVPPCPPPCFPPSEDDDEEAAQTALSLTAPEDKKGEREEAWPRLPLDRWFEEEVVQKGKFKSTKKRY